MGGDDDDEFRNFCPRKRWAETNNEHISGIRISISELASINRMVRFLKDEKTIEEMIRSLKIPRGQIVRYLGLMREIKGINIERRDLKGVVGYRIIDLRKKS